MEAWGLPPEAWETVKVKIVTSEIGSREEILLGDVPICNYSLAEISQRYGPGKYTIRSGPGLGARKSSTIRVAEKYARDNGFASPPAAISAGEQLAAKTFMTAQERGMDRAELNQMIEVAIQKAQPQTMIPQDPMQAMMRGIEFYQGIQAKAVEGLKLTGALSEPAGPRSLGDALVELAPSIVDAIKAVLPIIATAMAAPPTRAQPQVQQSSPQQTLPDKHQEDPAMQPPQITQEEAQAITPIVSVLRPYAQILIKKLATGKDPREMARGMAGLIGPELEESVIAFNEAGKKYGTSIFAFIHPGLVSQGASVVLNDMAELIKQERAE